MSEARRRKAAASPLASLLEAMPFAQAAYAAADGRLVAANARFEEAFGGLGGHATRQGLLDALDAAPGAEGEARAPHTRRWYALHWGEAEVAEGRVRVLSAIDVSERREALALHRRQQEKLLSTSRMMSVGEMAATLAHELNQPLAAIVNYLNGSLRLVGQAGGPAQVERALVAARLQAEHASAVIARVREFVRAREPKRDAHTVADIAGNVIELLRLEAERLSLRIELALAPDLPAVWADRVMIEQVLLNLVKNAIEAMREVPAGERELRVQARVDLDGEVEVLVLDRGSGFSDAEREQLFSPFFTTKSDGLGIGLSICRSIIEYHEGRLFFEGREGGGSVFGFTLPSAANRA